MIKKLTIGEKEVTFANNALTPVRYKEAFNSDYFGDLMKLSQCFDGEKITDYDLFDSTVLSRLAWACAKTYDEKVPSYLEWLKENEEFNLFSDGMEIVNMLLESISTKKN